MAYFRLSPPRRTDIGNVLTQDLEDMHISTLAVYVQNFPVVCDKPEQLIWVKKQWLLVLYPRLPAHQKNQP